MSGRVMALGFFDGVHIGHGKLLKRAVEVAAQAGGVPCALTFDSHPDALILGQPPLLLNTVPDRELLMTECYGIRQVLPLRFDSRLMRMPWDVFVTQVLAEEFGATHVVAGDDFHFGFQGAGNPKRLQERCVALGLGCDIIPKISLDGLTVSSTYIRRLVAQGDMTRAREFLGHPHLLTGRVGYGNQVGTRLGTPTLNLSLPPELQPPAFGVYVTRVTTQAGSWNAVTNVGVRPTVTDSKQPIVESTLLDFSGDLYGQVIRVEFLQFLRPEQRFAELDALKAQIGRDLREARRYFEHNSGEASH